MAIDISNLPEFTDAELLKLYRWAMVNGAAGTTRSFGPRSLTFPALPELQKTIEWLERRIAADTAAPNGLGHALVQFGEPR